MAETLNELVLLDEERLYELLGKAAAAKDFGAKDIAAMALLGKAWFQLHARELQNRICANAAVRVFIDGENPNSVILEAAAVIDAVTGILNGPAVAIFAILIVKTGLATYCSTQR